MNKNGHFNNKFHRLLGYNDYKKFISKITGNDFDVKRFSLIDAIGRSFLSIILGRTFMVPVNFFLFIFLTVKI